MKARIAPAVHSLAHASGLSGLLARRRRGMRVVMYHGVTSGTARAFAAQIEYLASHFSIVPLRTILERVTGRDSAGRAELALTFDDGLRNNSTIVYPILERRGVTATFFVCPGLIEARQWLWNHEVRERLRWLSPGLRAAVCRSVDTPSSHPDAVVEWMKTLRSERRARVEETIRSATADFAPTPEQRERFDLMTWGDLTSLDPRVVEIGSHTVSHAILTALDSAAVRAEIEDSRRQLEARLGRPVDLFAYPNGAHDPRAVAAVRECYRGAVSTLPAVVAHDADAHRLPRIPAAGRLSLLAWRMHRPAA
jgi:peptidoglycan/xylan/chitin deacetylase (PgdA/CDA1 family)